jgi:uncharacterized membrane protein
MSTPQQPDTNAPQQPGTSTPQPEQAIPAVGILVVAFTDENAADQALDAMKQAKKQQQFYFEEAAVIRQDVQGKVHYHETGDMSTGKGAGIGALVGGVIGVLAGPAGVALGASAGAAVGAAFAHADGGFNNESLGILGTALRPGTSAIVVITSRDFLKAVRDQVAIEDIRMAVGNLSRELGMRLQENKDVAVGLLLTEQGLAIKEVAVDDDSAEVIGAVITEGGVVAGAAVVTADGAVVATGVIPDEGAAAVDAAAPEQPAPAAQPPAA